MIESRQFLSKLLILIFLSLSGRASVAQQIQEDAIQTISPIKVIDILSLQPHKIQDLSKNADESLKNFLKAYDKVFIGQLNEAEATFSQTKNSKNSIDIAYANYGLLLISSETGNMVELATRLDEIKNTPNKPEWLEQALIEFQIIYHYNVAEHKKTELLLNQLSSKQLSVSPSLTAIRVALLLRKNSFRQAEELLHTLTAENISSIAVRAQLIYLSKGIEETINYLKTRENEFPNSEFVSLLYNEYLSFKEQETAVDTIYNIGNKTKDSFILLDAQRILMQLANHNNLDKLNELYHKVSKTSNAFEYIDYYVNELNAPFDKETKIANLKKIKSFNPMHQGLLWNEYYYGNKNHKLDFLKKIEHLDPYSNSVLLELAKFYALTSQKDKLKLIKNKFQKSPRVKSEGEIKQMQTIYHMIL